MPMELWKISWVIVINNVQRTKLYLTYHCPKLSWKCFSNSNPANISVKYVLKKTKTFLIQWNTITLYVMRRIDNSIWGSHNVTLISCLFETSNSKVYLVVLNTSVPSYIFKERTRILHLNWWKFDDFKKHRIKYR